MSLYPAALSGSCSRNFLLTPIIVTVLQDTSANVLSVTADQLLSGIPSIYQQQVTCYEG